MRRRGLPLFSVDSHEPAGELRPPGVQPLRRSWSTPTSSTAWISPACRCEPPSGGPEHPLVVAGGHCTFNPEPLADFVDVLRHRRRGRGGRGDHRSGRGMEGRGADRRVAAAAPPGPRLRARGVRAVPLRRGLRRAAAGGGDTPVPGRAREGGEADHRRSGRVAVPQDAAGPHDRGGPRPAQRRDLPRLHPWVPVLPGGHDHQAGTGTAGGSGAADGPRRSRADRLRRGEPHLLVECRLLGDRRDRDGDHRRSGLSRPGVGQPPVTAGRRVHGRSGQPDPEGAPHRV